MSATSLPAASSPALLTRMSGAPSRRSTSPNSGLDLLGLALVQPDRDAAATRLFDPRQGLLGAVAIPEMGRRHVRPPLRQRRPPSPGRCRKIGPRSRSRCCPSVRLPCRPPPPASAALPRPGVPAGLRANEGGDTPFGKNVGSRACDRWAARWWRSGATIRPHRHEALNGSAARRAACGSMLKECARRHGSTARRRPLSSGPSV